MSILDDNIEINTPDILKYACINFFKNHFKLLNHNPKNGILGDVIYINELDLSDVLINPNNYILFWGYAYLPDNYKPGHTELDVIIKIASPGNGIEEDRTGWTGHFYTTYNNRRQRMYACEIQHDYITVKDMLNGNFDPSKYSTDYNFFYNKYFE